MKKILVNAVFIIFLFQGCDYYNHEELLLVNNSNHDIVYVYSFDSELTIENSNYNKDTLKIGDSIRSLSKNPWRYNIKTYSKDSTLRVYFVNTPLFKKYEWNDIVKQKKYLMKKYTLKQLDSLKWKIIHDQSEANR